MPNFLQYAIISYLKSLTDCLDSKSSKVDQSNMYKNKIFEIINTNSTIKD